MFLPLLKKSEYSPPRPTGSADLFPQRATVSITTPRKISRSFFIPFIMNSEIIAVHVIMTYRQPYMDKLQDSDDHGTLSKQQSVIDDLVQDRFSIRPDYFSAGLDTALYQELQEHRREHRLRAAHVGKERQRVHISTIRGDSILWLNGDSAAQRSFLDEMEQLRQLLNQRLFLGLVELEAHFAYYPPGAGYQKHLDSFRNNNLRRVSIIAYLNPAWLEEDGGELLIYKDDELIAKVPPNSSTLACFISEEILHQVATTRCGRASIAGWFRVREIGGGVVRIVDT